MSQGKSKALPCSRSTTNLQFYSHKAPIRQPLKIVLQNNEETPSLLDEGTANMIPSSYQKIPMPLDQNNPDLEKTLIKYYESCQNAKEFNNPEWKEKKAKIELLKKPHNSRKKTTLINQNEIPKENQADLFEIIRKGDLHLFINFFNKWYFLSKSI